MVDLNSLIPPNSPLTLVYAYAINDLGEIVGNGPDVNGNGHAFLLIPCDQNHPRLEGCDYCLVDETSTAAQVMQPAGAISNVSKMLPAGAGSKGRLQMANRRQFGALPPK